MSDTCKWIYNYMIEDGVYETSCSHSFFFDSGDVKENNFKFCPFCGKEIEAEEPPVELWD